MVTGETPFGDSTQVSVLAKIIEKRQEPAERYQDTQELVADLRVLRRQFESGLSENLTASRSCSPIRPGSMLPRSGR